MFACVYVCLYACMFAICIIQIQILFSTLLSIFEGGCFEGFFFNIGDWTQDISCATQALYHFVTFQTKINVYEGFDP